MAASQTLTTPAYLVLLALAAQRTHGYADRTADYDQAPMIAPTGGELIAVRTLSTSFEARGGQGSG